jgi:hypothetical protein
VEEIGTVGGDGGRKEDKEREGSVKRRKEKKIVREKKVEQEELSKLKFQQNGKRR